MDIVFKDKKLRKTMNDAGRRRKAFGSLAAIIGRRLDDLLAAATLHEAFGLPGRLEALTGNRQGQYSMRLDRNHRLILEAGNEPLPRKEDGGTDLRKVTVIRILGVEDYHQR